MTFASLTHAAQAWCLANPLEALALLGVVLNVLNGLLPATIRTGPVGTVLHVALDRVTILTRRNAPGTLKWPLAAGSILRAVADSLNPPTPTMTLDVEPPAPPIAGRYYAPTFGGRDARPGEALPGETRAAAPSRDPVAPPAPTPPGGVAFDPSATQTIAPDVVAAAQRATAERESGE